MEGGGAGWCLNGEHPGDGRDVCCGGGWRVARVDGVMVLDSNLCGVVGNVVLLVQQMDGLVVCGVAVGTKYGCWIWLGI